jgi:hypothetical protein
VKGALYKRERMINVEDDRKLGFPGGRGDTTMVSPLFN